MEAKTVKVKDIFKLRDSNQERFPENCNEACKKKNLRRFMKIHLLW